MCIESAVTPGLLQMFTNSKLLFGIRQHYEEVNGNLTCVHNAIFSKLFSTFDKFAIGLR